MASETTADQMQVSEADKQKDIAKLDELLVEGLKKLDELDAESAVDLLSEAAKLAGSIYEAFAPEAYNAHMQYGRALIALASDEISKLRVKGESNDKKDETEETEQPDKTEDEPEIIAEESAGGGEITDADETLKPEENAEDEPLDELEEMLNDAWNVLEIAKQTCEKQLQSVKEDSDVRQWKLKMSEPLHFLGRVLILNGKPEEAKAEFTASLDIKQQLLDDDRTLADTFHEIAESFTNAYNFADAKTYFEKALEAFSKKIVSLEAAKDDEDTSAEIKELRDICKEVQDKIADVIESEKAVLDFKENVQGAVRSLPPVDSSSFNDVTHTIKRRIADSGDKQVEAELVKRPLADDDESDDIAAKKAKAQ